MQVRGLIRAVSIFRGYRHLTIVLPHVATYHKILTIATAYNRLQVHSNMLLTLLSLTVAGVKAERLVRDATRASCSRHPTTRAAIHPLPRFRLPRQLTDSVYRRHIRRRACQTSPFVTGTPGNPSRPLQKPSDY